MATRTATAWDAGAKPGWTVRVTGVRSEATPGTDANGLLALDQEFATDSALVGA